MSGTKQRHKGLKNILDLLERIEHQLLDIDHKLDYLIRNLRRFDGDSHSYRPNSSEFMD